MHEAWEKSFHSYQGRERNRNAREKQRRVQRRIVEAHLGLLEELGYLRDELVAPRGRVAQVVGGYELQVTELLFRGVLENLPARCLAVAAADGVTIPGDVQAAVRGIASTMPSQYSSTAQDLARGKPTEIDHLNGYVVKRGAALGVPTPLNHALQVLVKLAEMKRAAG